MPANRKWDLIRALKC